MIYRGGCHCGKVRLEVAGDLRQVSECNCSICTKKAYLHWIVSRESFHLITPETDLATYQFNTRAAKHHFCPVCGVASFYIPRSDPDKIDINVRCLDDLEVARLARRQFDGRHWEQAQRNALGERS